MPLPETLRVNDPYPTREPNMNTTTTDMTEREEANFLTFPIFIGFVLVIAMVTAFGLWGCNPQDYPGAPEASAAPHGEQGDIRTLPK